MAFLSRTCSSKSLRQVSRMRFPVVRTLIHLCIMHYNNHTNRSLFWVLLSLCLSRACLGKMIGFVYKWRKSGVFRTSRQPTAWCETAETKPKTHKHLNHKKHKNTLENKHETFKRLNVSTHAALPRGAARVPGARPRAAFLPPLRASLPEKSQTPDRFSLNGFFRTISSSGACLGKLYWSILAYVFNVDVGVKLKVNWR